MSDFPLKHLSSAMSYYLHHRYQFCPSVSLSLLLLLFLSGTGHFTCPPLVENVQLSLALQTENKGSVVTGGQLNVCLDGMVVDLGSLPNGGAAADSESHLYHTHTHNTQ